MTLSFKHLFKFDFMTASDYCLVWAYFLKLNFLLVNSNCHHIFAIPISFFFGRLLTVNSVL